MGMLAALLEAIVQPAVDKWTDSLSKDYRNDPVYKHKL
jgi:hypothetical protein